MLSARLTRETTGDQGTFGVLKFAGFTCLSLELPDRRNEHGISCIPVGTYTCAMFQAVHSIGGRRDLYLVNGVPGRSGIFLHAGNWAGDRKLEFRSNSLGCILLGLRKGLLAGQRAILNSAASLSQLYEYTQKSPFELTIEEGR